MTPDSATTGLFIGFSRSKLEEYWSRLRSAVESLTPEQVWWRPNDASNSVGNLLLHLNGNVRQWIVASFTEEQSTRNRPAEFAERQMQDPTALLSALDKTMRDVDGVLARLSDTDLHRTLEIQGYTVKGLDAVYHVVEHFGIHYGQILYVTKMLQGTDLGFYRALDKTGRL